MDKIILASQSPRRKQLLEQAGFQFEIISADVDEMPPEEMAAEKVPEFLACKKAAAIETAHANKIIIAADTIVLIDDEILGKPKDVAHAKSILKSLSGRMHKVITGVCIQKGGRKNCFSVTTEVFFRMLEEEQIDFYINEYQPFDKAGAYAIQEWIGLVGIEKINGDFYNVMGLPVSEVVLQLKNFSE